MIIDSSYIIVAEMESYKSSKKKERVRMYKKKMRNIQESRPCRPGRAIRLSHTASKSNDKVLDLTSQITVLKKAVNKTGAYNKLLQRFERIAIAICMHEFST